MGINSRIGYYCGVLISQYGVLKQLKDSDIEIALKSMGLSNFWTIDSGKMNESSDFVIIHPKRKGTHKDLGDHSSKGNYAVTLPNCKPKLTAQEIKDMNRIYNVFKSSLKNKDYRVEKGWFAVSFMD